MYFFISPLQLEAVGEFHQKDVVVVDIEQVIHVVAEGKLAVTDGVFDLAGSFHPLPGFDSNQATILFLEKAFAMMKGNNRFSDGLVEKIRNWHHSGFSVHNEVVINENDREALGS